MYLIKWQSRFTVLHQLQQKSNQELKLISNLQLILRQKSNETIIFIASHIANMKIQHAYKKPNKKEKKNKKQTVKIWFQ